MILEIFTFASFREQLGSSFKIELAESATVAELKSALRNKYPDLKSIIERTAISVNQEYASDSVVLAKGDEIALIPPVSGG